MTDRELTKIDRIHELITGGDDPRKGVVFRLEQIEEALRAEREQREQLALRMSKVEHSENAVLQRLDDLGNRMAAQEASVGEIKANMNWVKWIGIALLSFTAGGTGLKVADSPLFSHPVPAVQQVP